MYKSLFKDNVGNKRLLKEEDDRIFGKNWFVDLFLPNTCLDIDGVVNYAYTRLSIDHIIHVIFNWSKYVKFSKIIFCYNGNF